MRCVRRRPPHPSGIQWCARRGAGRPMSSHVSVRVRTAARAADVRVVAGAMLSRWPQRMSTPSTSVRPGNRRAAREPVTPRFRSRPPVPPWRRPLGERHLDTWTIRRSPAAPRAPAIKAGSANRLRAARRIIAPAHCAAGPCVACRVRRWNFRTRHGADRAPRSAVRQTLGAALGSLPSASTGGIPVRSPGQH